MCAFFARRQNRAVFRTARPCAGARQRPARICGLAGARLPDEAFATTPGDDKNLAAALRKRNKAERTGQTTLKFSPEIERQLGEALEAWHALDALPEQTPEQIEDKKQRFVDLTQSADAMLMEQLAAIPIAQFYMPKEVNRPGQHVTEEEFRRYWRGERKPLDHPAALAWAMAERKRFFHWFLAFPEVVARGGFDCVMGNGLKLVVELGGERSTAAIDSLKVIAFDLAVMCMSIEGGTRLPAFLLHDSPREADLGLSVYHRLFALAKGLEALGPALFQYIVTTTTQPPDEVQMRPWLRESLRGSPAQERLLRLDL